MQASHAEAIKLLRSQHDSNVRDIQTKSAADLDAQLRKSEQEISVECMQCVRDVACACVCRSHIPL